MNELLGEEQVLETYVGLSWGDEGKGKLVDEALERAERINPHKRRIVLRYQGGPNAGHSISKRLPDGKVISFVNHSAPSGLTSNSDLGIGPDSAFDPEKFLDELNKGRESFNYNGRVLISERTGILFDYHAKLDKWREESAKGRKIGTTKSGIGPFYEDNARRVTRITFADYVSDKFHDKLKEVLELKKLELSAAGILGPDYLGELIANHDPIREELKDFKEGLEYRLMEYLENGDHIIIESSQGSDLDVNMGTIPDQTSSHLLAPYAFPSLGLPRRRFKIYGVEKIYPTRVGNGEMPTLVEEEVGEMIVKNAGEFGATTGRKRRPGYPDWTAIKRATRINDCDGVYLTRADCIQDIEIKAGIGYYIGGKISNEVPLDLSKIEKVLYQDKTYKWKLWDGQRNLSNASDVDEELKLIRQQYVEGGFESLPLELREYIADHDKFIGCETIGVSIGPTRGETVRKY